GLGLLGVLIVGHLLGRLAALGDDVADGDDLHVGVVEEGAEVVAAHGADADEAEVDAVVRRAPGGAGGQRPGGGAGGEGADEVGGGGAVVGHEETPGSVLAAGAVRQRSQAYPAPTRGRNCLAAPLLSFSALGPGRVAAGSALLVGVGRVCYN